MPITLRKEKGMKQEDIGKLNNPGRFAGQIYNNQLNAYLLYLN